MDWKTIIADIVASGLTQGEIAKIIGIKQPSVCSIACGDTKDPRWSTAQKLLDLHRGRVRQPQKEVA